MTVTNDRPAALAPAEPWSRCLTCGALVYRKKLARNLNVCPECGRHHRLTAPERIAQLVDEGTFAPLGGRALAGDVLGFTDARPYAERLAEARRRTGLDDAVVCGAALIGGMPVCLAVMDFRFMGGSLGTAVGELITRAAERALADRCPLLIVTASGGARMQEGALSLMQMAKVSQALGALGEAGLLSVSLVTDPTYGGVAASFATNCDIVLVEQGARMGFAGPRVIEQTIRQKLPADFQTADFLLARGQVDAVRHRRDLREWLRRLFLATRAVAAAPAPAQPDPVVAEPHRLDTVDPWQAVTAARDTARPTLLDYLRETFDGFVELRGDRLSADCPAVVAGFAMLDCRPVAVVGHQKGHHTRELVSRNFGMPRPEGYRKALRVMKLAARLGLPIVTVVDTPGAYPGREAEENGQSAAIAGNILAMFGLATPVITVITGEGGSGGALALAVADQVLIAERGTYSVISPEGCSAILWGDAACAPDAARALRITARELLELGIVDGVLPEPPGGAAADPTAMASGLRVALGHALARLDRTEPDGLLARRRRRFRAFGADGSTDLAPAPTADKGWWE
ncbi:acetyl-CoA carboxylase, carboxyltransferase subunit beta [Plantactinospora sp. KBS50]|uniref:acetyl-CoA carboxylase, carboxyltransferase subunit beta n=1 Tax=Plantactinospora sp. KBS50 TaxID=2024580 RepID=UPI000BAAB09E|nr:acetyl-CoA carboxylase, carboxyltransferase subunit beta [Plantactinospora sp. KBS50]ASW56787.1 acetyl-CoA carboxylase carboxyl transferase subunit beta [Plantactinospora sp. KBS50]